MRAESARTGCSGVVKARLLTRARAARAQAEPVVRMFEILRKDECQWVAQADLKSMLAGILLSHPGLEFLQVGRPGPLQDA